MMMLGAMKVIINTYMNVIDTVASRKMSHPVNAEGGNKPFPAVPRRCCLAFSTSNKLKKLRVEVLNFTKSNHRSREEKNLTSKHIYVVGTKLRVTRLNSCHSECTVNEGLLTSSS